MKTVKAIYYYVDPNVLNSISIIYTINERIVDTVNGNANFNILGTTNVRIIKKVIVDQTNIDLEYSFERNIDIRNLIIYTTVLSKKGK